MACAMKHTQPASAPNRRVSARFRTPRQGAPHLSNCLHVVVPGSHGVGGPCVESLMRASLTHGSVTGLDTSCVAQIRPPPFNLGKPEARP